MPAINLTTKKARAALDVRRDPYFQKLSTGAFLGFRRGPDTWIARFRDRTGQQHHKPLGTFEEYSDAKKAAEEWIAQLSGSASRAPKRGTVLDALTGYLQFLRDSGRGGAAVDADRKFGSSLYDDELAQLPLEQTTREDWMAWRRRLVDREIKNVTVNRYVTSAVAAMNVATTQLGHTGNSGAWTFPDLPDDSGDGESAVYLTSEQRARLIKHATQPWLDKYLRALYAAGGRPGEIAEATVADYDQRQHTVVLRSMKGRPAKLRARVVQLDPKDKPLFLSLIKDKLPTAPLITDESGAKIARHAWIREIKASITYANATAKPQERIDEEATAYSFRHSRIAELLQIYNVDPMTVAAQTGTSLAMMQKYYWKFIPSAMLQKFEAVKSA